VAEYGSVYRCDTCNISVENPNAKYIFQMKVVDHSGEMYLGVFNDHGNTILGNFLFLMINIRSLS